mgnify:FL=1
MYELDVYIGNTDKKYAKIRPLTIKRDWMDEETYNCYPITSANPIGYALYFDEDISFIWEGDLKKGAFPTRGEDNIWVGRPRGTVSFDTNLIFKSNENTSLLIMPVPNHFIQDANVVSATISTSFFTGALPVVWKLNVPNKEYFISAGSPIACLLPVSLAQFKNTNLNIMNKTLEEYRLHNDPEYVDEIHRIEREEKIHPRFYFKGVNHYGEKVGNHEVVKLNMKVTQK